MAISYNLPGINLIKEFSSIDNVEEWLPGLFDGTFNNLFPIDITGNLNEKTEFSKSKSNIDDFTISLKRYYLFLYCLKSKPFLFENVSRAINYTNDEFLFVPEVAGYVSDIQTNKIKNTINSSLTIDQVKKYAVDKSLDFLPQKLSDYFDIAKTEDYINYISRTLNTILYESVIKHTLYDNLKSTSFNFFEGTAAGWVDKAIKLGSGNFEYFIDVEGGPDNKSFPVVCVLTKRLNEDKKEQILKQSNDFISNIFGKKIGNECFANIIGNPGVYEDNFKSFPILKSRKDEKTFYNAICVVYDLSKIILSKTISRNFDTQSILEVALGFFTKYSLEVNNIDELKNKSEALMSLMQDYFNEDSFSEVEYYYFARNKHVEEVYNRINVQDKFEILKSISQVVKINRGNITSAFNEYVNLLISTYKEARRQNIYLTPFDSSDFKVTFHFDSFLNLLGVTTIPNEKKKQNSTKQYSPFKIETFDNFGFGEADQKYVSEEFFGKYQNLTTDLIDYSGRRICVATRTLERMLYDSFDRVDGGYLVTKDLTSTEVEKKYVNLITKINLTLPNANFNYNKEDLFINERLIDKSIRIANLTTNYRENKYQSIALQTMAFYLINTESGLSLFGNEGDLKKFGESFHYPVLTIAAAKSTTDEFKIGDVLKLPDLDIPQEILLVSTEIQKTFEFIKGNEFSVNDLVKEANSTFVSSLPCYADIVNVINDFRNIDDGWDLVETIMVFLNKFPLSEFISELLQKLLSWLGVLNEYRDPCKPLPSKFPTIPDDLFSTIEYLKDLYARSLNPEGLIQGIIESFPTLDTLDFWLTLIEKIALFLLKIAADFILKMFFDFVRPYLEKLCSLDFELFKPPFFNLENSEDNFFSPSIASDSFGAPAESGSSLYDVQLAIDINVLIDLSEIATRDLVYSKFADEYSLEKSQNSFDEISKFLSDISSSIDLYELASLLRNVSTESTRIGLIDTISLVDAPFKNLFAQDDDIIKLFIFLSNYCDYRICYDILSKSLEKYVGNICTPQQSRRKDYELLLKETVGDDYKNVIRDQILDLEKQFDKLCSNKLLINIDLFKDGPRLLASSLTQYMVMPFQSIIDFQQNIYDYEKSLTDDQKKILKFSTKPPEEIYAKYLQSVKLVKSKYNTGYTPEIIYQNAITKEELLESATNLVNVDNKYLEDFNLRKSKIVNYFNTKNIIIDNDTIKEKINYELYVDPLYMVGRLFEKLASKNLFIKNYNEIAYSIDYLEKLKLEMEQEVQNATNIDMQDDIELFMSYISKIKE